MALIFFNDLTRTNEEFVPLCKDVVTIYSCGPTVYNFPHIGNYRAFLFNDVLRRYLKFRGYKVKHVMNLTDVDDKTIRDSQKEGISLREFTNRYADAFFSDLKKLNAETVEFYPRATDYIPEMVDVVSRLIAKGHTYEGEDGIYFRISSFPSYGKLAGIKVDDLKEGARVKQDEYDKEHAADFVLWKKYQPDDGAVFWETKLGKGRPGWHIECSAMSTKLLGDTIDIHTGGVDLIFPHHENEIAQSECATGKQFVRCWMHNEFILVNGKKMSKSLGNFYTLRDLIDKDMDVSAIRYVLISTHYRMPLNFTFEGVDAARQSILRLRELAGKLADVKDECEPNPDVTELINKTRSGFIESMDDDLNISGALAAVFEFVKSANTMVAENSLSKSDADKCYDLLMQFDAVIGVIGDVSSEKIPIEVTDLAEERLSARKKKDWAESDRLRTKITDLGYTIDDNKEGYRLKRL